RLWLSVAAPVHELERWRAPKRRLWRRRRVRPTRDGDATWEELVFAVSYRRYVHFDSAGTFTGLRVERRPCRSSPFARRFTHPPLPPPSEDLDASPPRDAAARDGLAV